MTIRFILSRSIISKVVKNALRQQAVGTALQYH